MLIIIFIKILIPKLHLIWFLNYGDEILNFLIKNKFKPL
jgi:hypothetical protein